MKEDVKIKVDQKEFTLNDYHLCIKSYSIGIPEVKTTILEIPYSSVFYDYTEYFGKPNYKPRPITINCELMKSTPCWQAIIQEIIEILHGRLVEISFVSDSDWWYKGRISVSTEEHEEWNFASISFSLTCEPYKYNVKGEKKI